MSSRDRDKNGGETGQREGRFLARKARRERTFKVGILAVTLGLIVAMLWGSSTGRYLVGSTEAWGRRVVWNAMGMEPPREETAAAQMLTRTRSEDACRAILASYFTRNADPAIKHLFEVCGMTPEAALIGSGRADDAFVLSSKVFESDEAGRSYRLRPGVRSVWLRQVTLHEGPFGLFLVPDTPEVREAAGAAGAIVDEPSIQTTNSWGLRGPEPDLDADLRVLVLGDSFMLGMFNGDDDTPPICLERELAERVEGSVSVLNTGHIGYAPEQYFHTLAAYGDRFQPHAVVISVCPNDFGPGMDVLLGGGDDWDEAEYWLGEIVQWCRSRTVPFLLVPVPCDPQIAGSRNDVSYPARINAIFPGGSMNYCNPLDHFIDENLELVRAGEREGNRPPHSPLYNLHIADNHLSPIGARLWAEIVARRLLLLRQPHGTPWEDVAQAGEDDDESPGS